MPLPLNSMNWWLWIAVRMTAIKSGLTLRVSLTFPIVTMLDRESTSITSYTPVELPHYLQVEPYIRDALSQYGYDERVLDSAVEARLSRRPSSLRRPGSFTFYLSEAALNGGLGSLTVTHEQLAYLTTVSSLPPFHIRLVPADTPLTGIRAGFTLYRHSEYRPVLHLQQPTTSLFLENDTDITFYESRLQHIASLALSRDETRKQLTDRLAEIKPQSA
ncbi:DUF5753 domain-containing protein [Amycolatopsis sp. cmx-11-32]|uniref:DUF5753 domain-containing protein n=1 Tax=Amycolatopsis sp. cmx-11-32 TaxID=2785796 RepID=UPI0039E6FF49